MTEGFTCPSPLGPGDTVQLAHGGGGRLMNGLIEQLFLPAFEERDAPSLRHDGAVVDVPPGARLAMSTDSYVVSPLRFPGGDIGSLAINGTVNDLAMCGARPAWLTVGFIIEEGLRFDLLETIVTSMATAAKTAGIGIVSGDTKVVDRGKADGLFINTAGVGFVEPADRVIAPARVEIGDVVLVSGDIGRHGVAVLAERDGLSFEHSIVSDCAAVHSQVAALFEAGIDVHCLRDLTSGGLAAALVEIAETRRVQIGIDEVSVPITEPVRGACEMLGLDPLHVANEGRFCAFVPAAQSEAALDALRAIPGSEGTVAIGHVTGEGGHVTARSPIGIERIVDLFSGEQLPRIC